ncbi:hypothetical protein [Pseudoalteromonas umbrosa]|uniref:hypothetical protein n=1 Tax=Pseudoalteromonas umbrosa TaxID=3048489 RepID=UPI0024C2F9D6|nr:hypothetical protein [Pseudoalteromonas sp. B95]MDK1290084.1 hypothetical protein [Pseudoalteromonas sp. B95]
MKPLAVTRLGLYLLAAAISAAIVVMHMGCIEGCPLLLLEIANTTMLAFSILALITLYDMTPKAQVNRLLFTVLHEARSSAAKSVTFVVNKDERRLYVDIDDRTVVPMCHYQLAPRLASLIAGKHNVDILPLRDGKSQAYFFTGEYPIPRT